MLYKRVSSKLFSVENEVCKILLAQLLAFAVEFIGKALKEQHAEDEFLEL